MSALLLGKNRQFGFELHRTFSPRALSLLLAEKISI
jgi:hypothetical protein